MAGNRHVNLALLPRLSGENHIYPSCTWKKSVHKPGKGAMMLQVPSTPLVVARHRTRGSGESLPCGPSQDCGRPHVCSLGHIPSGMASFLAAAVLAPAAGGSGGVQVLGCAPWLEPLPTGSQDHPQAHSSDSRKCLQMSADVL